MQTTTLLGLGLLVLAAWKISESVRASSGSSSSSPPSDPPSRRRSDPCSTADALGSVAAGTAGGAGAGAAFGPPGLIIGASAGLVAGIAGDKCARSRFQRGAARLYGLAAESVEESLDLAERVLTGRDSGNVDTAPDVDLIRSIANSRANDARSMQLYERLPEQLRTEPESAYKVPSGWRVRPHTARERTRARKFLGESQRQKGTGERLGLRELGTGRPPTARRVK